MIKLNLAVRACYDDPCATVFDNVGLLQAAVITIAALQRNYCVVFFGEI